MLADPWGRRLHAGRSVKPDQGKVQYLVEVCDPCETADFAYHVNGYLVSDFYTPRFFDSAPNPAVAYSFTGAIAQPLQVLPGGYLSWVDPATGHWWQVIYFGPNPTFRDLGRPTSAHENFRHFTDSQMPFEEIAPELKQGVAAGAPALKRMEAASKRMEQSSRAKAEALRTQIAAIKAGPQ
jgi:hypothetical protein